MSVSMAVFLIADTISNLRPLSTSSDIYQGISWSNCAGTPIAGGYDILGSGDIIQHSFNLPDHKIIRITADFLLVDSWDQEVLTIAVDGNPIRTFSKNVHEGTHLCGNTIYEDKWFYLDWQGSHTSKTLIIKITNSLDEVHTNESFGFTNLQIYYDDDCYHLYSECNYQGIEYKFCYATPLENQEEFLIPIKSIRIPIGKTLQLQDSQFQGGNLQTYTSDQVCIDAYSFPKFIQVYEHLI